MRIKVGVENNNEGRSIAWMLDFPGCFAYGDDGSEAILRSPEALLRYKEWVDSHSADSWMKDLQDFDVHLEEVFDAYTINETFDADIKGVEINAWFMHDWKPLTAQEIRRGSLILGWSRSDLLELVSSLTPIQLTQEFEGERWNILGVLRHVANAEHWYLDRLSLSLQPRDALASDTFERLLEVRSRMNSVLLDLVDKKEVRGVDGEFWSPRKILRRAAWHEIDHIQHIFRLISMLK